MLPKELAETFAKEYLSNLKIKHLFPPNTSAHVMKLRNHELLNVIHANTEQSSCVYAKHLKL